MIVFKKVKKTENNRSLHQSNQCTVIQFRIRHDRILSIQRISDFGKSIGFRRIRIRNLSHPYFLLLLFLYPWMYSSQGLKTKKLNSKLE